MGAIVEVSTYVEPANDGTPDTLVLKHGVETAIQFDITIVQDIFEVDSLAPSPFPQGCEVDRR